MQMSVTFLSSNSYFGKNFHVQRKEKATIFLKSINFHIRIETKNVHNLLKKENTAGRGFY